MYKPKLENIVSEEDDEEMQEEGESEMEDMEDDSESEDVERGKTGVYKVGKSNPVFYEESGTNKKKRDDEFAKKKMSRSEYLQELRKEMDDEPEEIHMGLKKKNKFIREMDELEELELDEFKRKSYTKKEMKALKKKEREHLEDKLDHLDDLNDIIKYSSSIGKQNDGEERGPDVLRIPKEFLK